MTDPRKRFSERVANYIRFRPGYPEALLPVLLPAAQSRDATSIADVGSGTGIFTRLLLQPGVTVYGVEPNANMRRAAEEYLADYENFVSVEGDAENTGLADASVDLVTAAQAFHWFNNDASRIEFNRILKPGGRLALIWNQRRLEQPFQQDYEALLRALAPEYGKVNHMNLDDDEIAQFYRPGQMQVFHFDNNQQFDFDGLTGRLKSSSYCPDENTPVYARLIDGLAGLFDTHAVSGRLTFEYDTRLYLGPIAQ